MEATKDGPPRAQADGNHDARPGAGGALARIGPAGAYLALATLIVLGAAVLRLVALDRVPPGLHFDEAVYGLLARDIVEGARPIFFSAYTGREPLYMYVMALLFAGVGDGAWTIRLTSALIGVLTVALLIPLGRSLYGRAVGLAAGGLLAASHWHLTVSRNGYPNVLIPPLEIAACYGLWRGWRDGRLRDWALGGALTGLVLYTYLAARFWPVFVAALAIYGLLVAPRQAWRRLPGLLVAFAAALLVFAPLAVHFLRVPADFTERASQVLAQQQLTGTELWQAYADNAWRSLRGILLEGDPRRHFNLPGKPMLGPLAALLFVAGALRSLAGLRDVRYGLPLLWLALLSLPGILTLEMQPAGQRMFGAIPALALLAAIGMATLAQGAVRLGRRLGASPAPARLWAGAFAALALLTVGAEGLATLRDYFGTWAELEETRQIFHEDYVTLAELAALDVAAMDGGEGPCAVVILAEHDRHATVAFVAPEVARRARWAEGRTTLPLPALPTPLRGCDGTRVYYRTASWVTDDSPAARWLDENALTRQRYARVDGRPTPVEEPAEPLVATEDEPRPVTSDVVRVVVGDAGAPFRTMELPWMIEGREPSVDTWKDLDPLSATLHWPSSPPEPARIGEELAVGTQEMPPEGAREAPRNEPLVLTVVAQVLHPPPEGEGRRFALHLRDEAGHTWAQSDLDGYLAREWQARDQFALWFELPLDREMPPGIYHAHLIVTDASGRVIPATLPSRPRLLPEMERESTSISPSFAVERIRVTEEGRIRREDETPSAWIQDEDGGGSIALLSAALDRDRASPGETLELELRLSGVEDAPVAEGRLDTLEVVLLPYQDDGAEIPLLRGPIAEAHPPSAWRGTEILRGRYSLPLPADLESDDYDLRVSIEGSSTTTVLGPVRVEGPPRSFHLPGAGETPSEAVFTGAAAPIRLLAWRVDPAEPAAPGGEAVALTLYWQADATPGEAWKVFAHLDAADGALLTQHDAEPAEGARPTTGWLPGEVVADTHHLELEGPIPPGATIGVGLYDPATGARLPVAEAPGEPAATDKLVLPWAPGGE